MCANPRSIPSLTYIDESQVFLNIVLDDAIEEKAGGEKVRIGQVVRSSTLSASHRTEHPTYSLQVIRGNSVVMLEALERMDEHDRR